MEKVFSELDEPIDNNKHPLLSSNEPDNKDKKKKDYSKKGRGLKNFDV